MKKSSITMKVIANAANTSVGTVDRALNNRGRINEETKQRIIRIAKELGYQANSIASALGRQKDIHIAVIMPQKPQYFCDEMMSGIKMALKELDHYGIKADFFLTDSVNPYEQEKLLQKFQADRYAGIAINVGGELLREYIDSYVDNGIPVVTFNSDDNGSKRLFYVGNDAFDSGCLAGELMGKMLMRVEKHCKIAVLVGFENVDSHTQRRDGFLKVIKSEYKNISIITTHKQYEDKAAKAQQSTKKILEQHPDIDGIFLTSSPGAIGAGNQIINMDMRIKPIIVGYDISKRVAEHLKMGVCTALIYQDPYRQGYYGVKLLARHLLEKWIPEERYFLIRSKFVMKHNLNDFVRDYRTHGKILD